MVGGAARCFVVSTDPKLAIWRERAEANERRWHDAGRSLARCLEVRSVVQPAAWLRWGVHS